MWLLQFEMKYRWLVSQALSQILAVGFMSFPQGIDAAGTMLFKYIYIHPYGV